MTQHATTEVPRRAGRTRLTPAREQELYEAVINLLRERGYDALTMDAVATRAKSSKATLYRQWKTKSQLVVSAMAHTKRVSFADIDTGSLEGDLREMVRRAGVEAFDDTSLLHALSHAGLRDRELLLALRGALIEPETDALHAALRRGVARGELDPENPAVDFIVHMFMGSVASRPLIDDAYPDADYLERYLDAVILPALRLREVS